MVSASNRMFQDQRTDLPRSRWMSAKSAFDCLLPGANDRSTAWRVGLRSSGMGRNQPSKSPMAPPDSGHRQDGPFRRQLKVRYCRQLQRVFPGAVSATHSTNFSAASMGISSGSQLMRACPLSLNLPSPAVPRLAAGYRHGGGTAPCDAKDPALGARSLTIASTGAEPAVCRPATVSAWERKVLHEGGVESACDMSV